MISHKGLILLFAALSAIGQAENAGSYAEITSSDFFPILTWDPQHGWARPYVDEKNGLQSIADCNFNMAGFVLPRDLKQCEKLGLGAILLPSDAAFTNGHYFRQWKDLSDQEIDQ